MIHHYILYIHIIYSIVQLISLYVAWHNKSMASVLSFWSVDWTVQVGLRWRRCSAAVSTLRKSGCFNHCAGATRSLSFSHLHISTTLATLYLSQYLKLESLTFAWKAPINTKEDFIARPIAFTSCVSICTVVGCSLNLMSLSALVTGEIAWDLLLT